MTQGLDKVALLSPSSGYLELGGAWSETKGAQAYGEVGYRPTDWWSLFGRGEYDQYGGAQAYGGVRFTW